jgi:SpoIID/LytB domain protein
MAIARGTRSTPDARPGARTLTAILLAALMLGAIGVPAAAAERSATDGVARSIALLPAGSASPASSSSSASPSPSPDPSPSPSASPSPVPDPTPVLSDSPSPSPSDSPSPSQTESPSPSPTPTPSPSPSPSATWPTTSATLGDTVQFFGRGYGHGVGLSQYGARGRALAGQTSDQILAAYYTGSAPATTNPTRNVRVRVLAGFHPSATTPLRIYGRGGPWTIAHISGSFPADAQVRIWRTTTRNGTTTTVWHLRVLAPDATTVLLETTVSANVVVRPASEATTLQLFSKPTWFDTYRGRLKVFLGSGTVRVVNHVGLDDYLRGVVPVEMPSSWPTEALAAQAVAARSYAVHRLHPGRGTFDLHDDTRSQVYRGVKAESSITDAVIGAAPGSILKSGSSVVNAFYHSTGGGATEDNEYAFVSSSGKVVAGPVSYLRGIEDVAPDGTPYDAAAPHYAWTTDVLSRDQLSAIMARDPRTAVGAVVRLNLTHRGVSGRLFRVALVGTAGRKVVSADVFRAVYNAYRPTASPPLRSNLFNLAPLP